MVYNGKPSTGCYLCRRRKIKCDETRPACRNCYVYGKDCPGYRPAIFFQDDTATAHAQKWRTSIRRSREQSNNDHDTHTNTPSFEILENTSLVHWPRSLADTTWEDRALCYFFEQYTIPKKVHGTPGALESLPPLYILCRENEVAGNSSSCLRWAVDAAALSAFAHEINVSHLDVQARKKYGMALHGVRKALTLSVESVKDDTLAAILVLALFEDINGERRGLQSSHTAGFELFVKLHRQRRLDGKYSRCLFNFAYTQFQIQILGLGSRPRIDTEPLIELFDPSDPLQRLMCTTTKLSYLRLNAPHVLNDKGIDGEGVSISRLLSYLSYAKSLDTELNTWCQSLSYDWLPRIVYSTTGESLITYLDIATGSLWNFWRSTRIILQSFIQRMYEQLEALTSGDPGDGVGGITIHDRFMSTGITPPEIIRELVDGICKSIPFTLGDIDITGSPTPPVSSGGENSQRKNLRLRAIEGYELIWPLWHTCTCSYSNTRQIRQAQNALQRLDSLLGIKLASQLAEEAIECHDNRSRCDSLSGRLIL